MPPFAVADATEGPGLWGSLLLGIVEGLTEFLPISSTGHLIVADHLLGGSDPAFAIAIQAGAITAILVLYWRDLWTSLRTLLRRRADGRPNLLWLLVVAALPAAVVGLLLEDTIERVLFGVTPVAVALIAGGVLLWLLEDWRERRARRDGDGAPASGGAPTQSGAPASSEARARNASGFGERPLAAMGFGAAAVIGVFQVLALVPGVSRAGATIAGGLVLGYSRPAAAEFSFLVGLPILYGACTLKVVQEHERLLGPMLPELLLASAAAFVTALLIVKPFVRFVQRHSFRPFAVYRVVAGAALLLWL